MSVTVLIVDDSKLARIIAVRVVTTLRPDWQCVEAANADAAMVIVAEQQIDVALLDYNMPNRNGLALAAELRLMRPAMPMAIITANVQDEVIAGASAVNAAFIHKPLTADGLGGFVSGAALRVQRNQLRITA